MKNLIKLSKEDLIAVNGGEAENGGEGKTFAYRVGQAIRGLFMCGSPAGLFQWMAEVYINE